MKKFNAKITCSLHSGGKFGISIEDATSRAAICRIDMKPEALALMLSGRAYQPATGELYDNYETTGKTKEMIQVRLPDRSKWMAVKYENNVSEIRAALLATAPTDEGWDVWCDGTSTQQNGLNHYKGTLFRYVENPKPPTI